VRVAAPRTETIRHGRVGLALHTLADREDAPPLLLLHALYGSSADWGREVDAWPGSVHALDFSGHGASDWLPGRGYAPEVFVAEADVALAHLEVRRRPHYVAGAGVGAYVALLLAGARPDRVAAALLWPGAGLAGGGALPGELCAEANEAWRRAVATPGRRPGESPPDPLVDRCDRDVRPLDYAREFARAARLLHVAEPPEVPPWLAAAIEHGRALRAPGDLARALQQLAP
jgi:pimeloyl-ACP methyl ester carboxylesterase